MGDKFLSHLKTILLSLPTFCKKFTQHKPWKKYLTTYIEVNIFKERGMALQQLDRKPAFLKSCKYLIVLTS